jgi:hypothetical protein
MKKLLLLLVLLLPGLTFGATYYVGPSATISTPCTVNEPCQPKEVFTKDLAPGDEVIFLDGTYQGANYMIANGSNDSGEEGNLLVIKALNDGEVWIDGQGANVPIALNSDSEYLRIEGFNAYHSPQNVVQGGGTAYVTYSRVIAWDGGPGNSGPFAIGENSTAIDCASFGVGRGNVAPQASANNATFRRFWGRWEGSRCGGCGPSHTTTPYYNNQGTTYENCLLTWDSGSMPAGTWYSHDQNFNMLGSGTGLGPLNPFGTVMPGQIDAESPYTDECVNVKMFGTISYITGQTNAPYNLMETGRFIFNVNNQSDPSDRACCFTIENAVVYVNPDNSDWSGVRALRLEDNCENYTGGDELYVTDVSTVAATSDIIHADWTQSDVEHATTVAGLADDIYTGDGARLCYEYEDRIETDEPMWPWPMQQRIFDATTFAADAGHEHYMYVCDPGWSPNCQNMLINDPHAVADVMGDMLDMFGAPPSHCDKRSNKSGS